METGTITDIKHFAVHDGPGIRTTLFLKGCPLHCLWCHNPEGLSFRPELALYTHKCSLCSACVSACPQGAHRLDNRLHLLDRERCVACGVCTEACPNAALTLYGHRVTTQSLLPELLEDRIFYENSGGGVTLSGGECLAQADFCRELLCSLKAEGIHTAVDSCLFVPKESLDKVIPVTDLFLCDIKAMDPEVHRTCTGVDNRLILENLHYLDARGCQIEIRYPFVPGFNDREAPAIADFISTLRHTTCVRVLPYHNLAGSKYAALNRPNTLPSRLPTKEELAAAEACFAK